MQVSTKNASARPWHREPWPWIIIGLLGAAIIASLITLWIAVTHPDYRVVDEAEYDRIKSELRAQPADKISRTEAERDQVDG